MGSRIIEISSSSSDGDDDGDDNISPPRGTCVKVKLEEGREMEKECYILDTDPYKTITIDINQLSLDSEEDDVYIIAERGPVACRDYPHSRHLCVNYPFRETDHESYCPQCYCYVCDAPAPCEHWQGTTGHCHACDQEEKWNELRKSCRAILAQSSG